MADSNKPVSKDTNNRGAEAQNIRRMAEIQSCLDSSGLEKIPESPITLEYRNLDLTKHRLVYDGPLTMKLGDPNRFKTTDLHVFLFENFILLLQKQKHKYLLKFHTNTKRRGPEILSSPVIKLPTVFARPIGPSKRQSSGKAAFHLLKYDAECTSKSEIYVFVASSAQERAQWIRHITEANNTAHNNREATKFVSDGKKVLLLGSAIFLMCIFISAMSALPTFL